MKKSRTKLIIFLVSIILLIIISIVLIVMGTPNDLTIKMYNSIAESENITFSFEGGENDYSYKTIVAEKDEDLSIDSYTKYKEEQQHVTTLLKDNLIYTIMHDEQEYTEVDGTDVEIDDLIPEKKDIEGKKYQKGREEINGRTYYYEEFENILTFLMLLETDEDANVKTRFYYDNNKNLVYIKNIVTHEEEVFEELIKTSYKLEVDNSLFEIPEDYAESQDE